MLANLDRNCYMYYSFLAPYSAPTILSADLVKSTSFVVKWELPPLHEINGYIRYFVLNITEVETMAITTIRVYKVTRKISNLHPYYNYTLTVAMMTTSIGPYSQPFSVQTKEAGNFSWNHSAQCKFAFLFLAPSAPPGDIFISEVGSKHANISWGPPPVEHQNGIIRLYQIRLMHNNENHTLSTSNTRITIVDLLPYHDYSFTIIPFTFIPGPGSEPQLFQTMEDGMHVVFILTLQPLYFNFWTYKESIVLLLSS